MATGRNRQQAPPPVEEPKRPIRNFGPYSVGRDTSVEAACWENQIEVESGMITTYNVTIKRSYRDQKTGEWKANQNYRLADLPILIHAIQKCSAASYARFADYHLPSHPFKSVIRHPWRLADIFRKPH